MTTARRQTLLFLLCAIVLLGVGYVWGYGNAYDKFYSPEGVLDRELVHMDLNSRLLYYTLLNRTADCRRELERALDGEVTLVKEQLAGILTPNAKVGAEASLKQAQQVLAGQPLTDAGSPNTDGHQRSR